MLRIKMKLSRTMLIQNKKPHWHTKFTNASAHLFASLKICWASTSQSSPSKLLIFCKRLPNKCTSLARPNKCCHDQRVYMKLKYTNTTTACQLPSFKNTPLLDRIGTTYSTFGCSIRIELNPTNVQSPSTDFFHYRTSSERCLNYTLLHSYVKIYTLFPSYSKHIRKYFTLLPW